MDLQAIEEIRESFQVFDPDQNDKIKVQDLVVSMKALGFDKKNPSIFWMIKEINGDKDQKIDFDEFLDLMSGQISKNNPKEDLWRVFKLFDLDSKGEITIDDLKTVSEQLGEELSERELHELIQRADLDKDGRLTFDDFYKIFTRKSFI